MCLSLSTQRNLHAGATRRCRQSCFRRRRRRTGATSITPRGRFGTGAFGVLSQPLGAVARAGSGQRRRLRRVMARVVRCSSGIGSGGAAWGCCWCCCVWMRPGDGWWRRRVVVVRRAVGRSRARRGCRRRLTIAATSIATTAGSITGIVTRPTPRSTTRPRRTSRCSARRRSIRIVVARVNIVVLRQRGRRRIRCYTRRCLRFSLEPFVEDGAFETHTLDAAFDAERLEMQLVVFHLDLAHLFLELLVLETILGCITLDGDGGRVGLGLGLDRLRCRRRC